MYVFTYWKIIKDSSCIVYHYNLLTFNKINIENIEDLDCSELSNNNLHK